MNQLFRSTPTQAKFCSMEYIYVYSAPFTDGKRIEFGCSFNKIHGNTFVPTHSSTMRHEPATMLYIDIKGHRTFCIKTPKKNS